MEHPVIITSNRVIGTAGPQKIRWYISAVSGSDSNDGRTPNTPLKTIAEMNRRQFKFTVINSNITVNIMSDVPITDPISFMGTLDKNSTVTFNGLTTLKK